MQEPEGTPSGPRDGAPRVGPRGRINLLVACAGIGLLLWARLILVSDMPRMALAEPKAGVESDPAEGDNSAGDAADGARGAETQSPDAAARPTPAESAPNAANPAKSHNRHSFTPEPPKSWRDPSD